MSEFENTMSFSSLPSATGRPLLVEGALDELPGELRPGAKRVALKLRELFPKAFGFRLIRDREPEGPWGIVARLLPDDTTDVLATMDAFTEWHLEQSDLDGFTADAWRENPDSPRIRRIVGLPE